MILPADALTRLELGFTPAGSSKKEAAPFAFTPTFVGEIASEPVSTNAVCVPFHPDAAARLFWSTAPDRVPALEKRISPGAFGLVADVSSPSWKQLLLRTCVLTAVVMRMHDPPLRNPMLFWKVAPVP